MSQAAVISTPDIADEFPGEVQALGTIPLKTEKRGMGQQDIPVSFGGVTIHPGDHVYVDNNGVLIARRKLL